MSEAERRAFRRASALLLVASVGRWAWAERTPRVLDPGADVLAELSEQSEEEARSEAVRARPLDEGERLDPNRAPAEQLDRLPGVGPATARAIVEEREAGGGFLGAEDLLRVRGVGPATLDRISKHLDFSRGTPARLHTPASVGGGAPEPVDVNRADAETLQSLPGVGPVLARRILEARRERPFSALEDLARVPGIGPATVARLRPRVTLGREPP